MFGIFSLSRSEFMRYHLERKLVQEFIFSPECFADELAPSKSKITNIFSTVHIFGFVEVVC